MWKVFLAGLLAATPALGQFTQISTPDATYTGATTLVPITASNNAVLASITGSGETISFSTSFTAASIGSGWGSWSSPPNAETATPRVITNTTSLTTMTITLSAPTNTFGFEVEPDAFGTFTITATFMNGSTVLGVVSRNIAGNAGARLEAATSSPLPITSVVIGSPAGAAGYALGQFRIAAAPAAPTSTVQSAPVLRDTALGGLALLLAASGSLLARRQPGQPSR